MKYWANICLLVMCLSLLTFGTNPPEAAGVLQSSDFLIDASKPYVYLIFDHIGPRKPLRDGEPKTGIWLRLKNNCRLPVVVIASAIPTQLPDEAIWVGDEVVPNIPPTGTESAGAGIGYQPGQEDLTDIFLSPNLNEAEVRGAEDAVNRAGHKERARRPHGYNDGFQPGAQVLRVISAGTEISFSLPVDHVSPEWHLEIPFRFALPNKSRIRPPYSYLAFYNEDLKDNHGTTGASPPAH